MTDHCIATHDPIHFLDEQWQSDILSDDEDFPTSHHSHRAMFSMPISSGYGVFSLYDEKWNSTHGGDGPHDAFSNPQEHQFMASSGRQEPANAESTSGADLDDSNLTEQQPHTTTAADHNSPTNLIRTPTHHHTATTSPASGTAHFMRYPSGAGTVNIEEEIDGQTRSPTTAQMMLRGTHAGAPAATNPTGGTTTTTLSTVSSAESSRRRSLQALRSPTSSPQNHQQSTSNHPTTATNLLPLSPYSSPQHQFNLMEEESLRNEGALAAAEMRDSLASSNNHVKNTNKLGGTTKRSISPRQAALVASKRKARSISQSMDSFFQHSARNYTHSTVLMTQHRYKNANVRQVNSLDTGMLYNVTPLQARNGMSNSTYTLQNNFNQQYYDNSYSPSNEYVNYEIPAPSNSHHLHQSNIPLSLSEFEDDSFMYNSHGMGGTGSLNSLGASGNAGGMLSHNSASNWTDVSLEQLWNDTLGREAR